MPVQWLLLLSFAVIEIVYILRPWREKEIKVFTEVMQINLILLKLWISYKFKIKVCYYSNLCFDFIALVYLEIEITINKKVDFWNIFEFYQLKNVLFFMNNILVKRNATWKFLYILQNILFLI